MGSNYIQNVAFVGAGGRSGRFMVDALLQTNRLRVTAITRPDSTSSMPSGLHDVKHVDYNNHQSLVEALKGQDALVITMNVFAPSDSQNKLVDAAAEAAVQFIIPNEWGMDLSKEDLGRETMLGERLLAMRRYIEKVGKGKTRWTSISCSFWYEFSLAGSEARYGFDFEKKRVTFFDDGNTKINHTTFAQVGRALASLLSLKLKPENASDRSPSLSQYADSAVCVSSFFVSQRDMLDSVLRVTGDSESSWTVSHENVQERYQRAVDMSKEGKLTGYVMLLYSRVFFPDGSGDINSKLQNKTLGLPQEDLDSATKTAIDMALAGETNMPE